MTIAIDYDGTYSADPALFNDLIATMKRAGHTVVLVTGRSEEYGHEIKAALDGVIPIVFAGMQWKRKAAIGAGFNVNVWIDDNPEYVDVQKH